MVYVSKRHYELASRLGKSAGKYAARYKRVRYNGPPMVRRAIAPNVTRQQDWRSSRKVKGRSKVKSIQHKRKRVKVSTKLRKKVQKVIDGTQHHGTYTTTRQGTIGVIVIAGSAVQYRSVDSGGYSGNAAVVNTKLPQDVSANARCWWSSMQSSDDGFLTGDEFQFFTPMKIIDAASVLWNQKVAANEYRTQTGNLNTVHNLTTGSLVTGSFNSMEIKGLKILVKNCYVKFLLKNNSQRSMKIEMYKCVPTSKNPLALALGTFTDACAREADATNSSLVSIVGPQANGKDNLVLMPAVEPNTFPSFKNEWKYEKVILKIAPGEATTAFCQGPRDYLLDYDKLNKGVESVQHLAFKKTSMNVMIAVTPDLVFATSAPVGNSGRFINTVATTGKVGDYISIETTEVYNLSMPDIVGFQNGPATDAGNMYTLNKRLNRRAYGNFVSQHVVDTAPGYSAFDEENPAAGIGSSREN